MNSKSETHTRNTTMATRDWAADIARAEQRSRALATQHPMMALGFALPGGYCIGRLLSRG